MIHYWGALIVLFLHLILGIVDQFYDDPKGLIQGESGEAWRIITDILPPLLMIIMLPFLHALPVFDILCILYGLWIVADTSQRWIKGGPQNNCDPMVSSTDTINPAFRSIFILFTALASIFVSYGMPNLELPIALPIIIPLMFMLFVGILGLLSGGDFFTNPEQIVIAYARQQVPGKLGIVGYIRVTLLVGLPLLGSLYLAYKDKYLEAGALLAGVLIIQPILIGLIYANQSLYEKAKARYYRSES